jgi:tRNA threonylcarbamoyladenosine biosynthesis protein TsaE
MVLESHCVEETLRLGQRLGQAAAHAPGTVCIALDGPLGAGKTHLTRGIAQGAGVLDLSLVCSPTFVLLNIYDADEHAGGRRVYHFDAYRINSPEELEALGFEEILGSNGGGGEEGTRAIVVVEWASRVADLLPADTLWITIEHGDDDHRLLDVKPGGELSKKLASELT